MEQQILETIQEIMKHIAIINDEYGELSSSVAVLTERVDWLCRFFWLIVGTTVSTLLINVWQSYKIQKNGKKI